LISLGRRKRKMMRNVALEGSLPEGHTLRIEDRRRQDTIVKAVRWDQNPSPEDKT
jgi:hypothetical protein